MSENEDHAENEKAEDDYEFFELSDDKVRPRCTSCGDPVKIVFHSGGVPMAAQHCKECYAELRWGKIPKYRRRYI